MKRAESVAQVGQVGIVEVLKTVSRNRLPSRRNRVISSDPPPPVKRDPLTKSYPL